jgi:hypothetical protein
VIEILLIGESRVGERTVFAGNSLATLAYSEPVYLATAKIEEI